MTRMTNYDKGWLGDVRCQTNDVSQRFFSIFILIVIFHHLGAVLVFDRVYSSFNTAHSEPPLLAFHLLTASWCCVQTRGAHGAHGAAPALAFAPKTMSHRTATRLEVPANSRPCGKRSAAIEQRWVTRPRLNCEILSAQLAHEMGPWPEHPH